MDVSVIIVNYNTGHLLRQALASIFDKTQDIEFEVIVVDNSSTDNSLEISRNCFPKVMFIKCENRGFGYANNEGVKYAKGKYLFFLNPDTILINNAIKILFDFMEKNQKCGICGGNLFTEDSHETHSYKMFFPSIFWELNLFFKPGALEMLRYGKDAKFNHSTKPMRVGYITGADLMIRSNLFTALQGFDIDFFVYFEETELAYRVKKAGYEVINVPEAEIIHLEGQSFSENWEKRIKMFLESRKIFYRKTSHPLYGAVCNALFYVGSALRCIVFKMLRNQEKYRYFKFLRDNM